MQERKKVLSITLEAIALIILAIVVYCGVVKLMFGPPICIMDVYILGPWTFSSKIPLIAVLTFDALWVATIKFWPLKNIHIKIVLTLLVLVSSAAFVTVYMIPVNFGF